MKELDNYQREIRIYDNDEIIKTNRINHCKTDNCL